MNARWLTDRALWERERANLRRQLWMRLGDLSPLFTPALHIDATTHGEGFTQHHFTFDNEAGATVYGLLLIPEGLRQPAPAMLMHHVHGNRYDWGKTQLISPHPRHGQADGIALAQRGFVVMGIDAYAFGERLHQGPAGTREGGRDTETSLFKQFLWQGKTLWGMMVRDDLLALNALLAHPLVDPSRVGTTGMSLGGSRATWAAAMDDRLSLVIPVGQMTRYADLLEDGELGFHSIYYFVPSMLKEGLDMEHLVALAAPQRQHIVIGDRDPSSPLKAVEAVQRYAGHVYGLYQAADRFTTTILPETGHEYTLAMHQAMIATTTAYLSLEP